MIELHRNNVDSLRVSDLVLVGSGHFWSDLDPDPVLKGIVSRDLEGVLMILIDKWQVCVVPLEKK
jgi:hypothetical protein